MAINTSTSLFSGASLIGLVALLSATLSAGCSSSSSKSQEKTPTQNSTDAITTTTNTPSNPSATSVLPNDNPSERSSTTPEPEGRDPDVICQEGALEECAQLSNGQEVQFPGGTPRGNCKKGFRRCRNGAWTRCEGTVQPAAQDDCARPGDDANCNGIPNEGCDCVDSQGPRACGETDVGICELGLQSCVDGAWQECIGEIKGRPEECGSDGVDEDCDGFADLEDSECDCVNGDEELCLLPAEGDCKLGKRACARGQWLACAPRFERLPREVCGLPRKDKFGQAIGDEDCDGKIDNNPGAFKDPIDCKMFMIDRDHDGFGAVGKPFIQAGLDYTHGCFCPNEVPSPALVPGDKDTVNKDCGDCVDGGVIVNPNTHAYFEKPSSCLEEVRWKGGAYDYNCDAYQEPKHHTIASCEPEGNRCKSNSGYWHASVPACGESGRVGTECMDSAPPCELAPPFGVEVQGCR